MGWSLPEITKAVKVGYGTAFRYIQGVEVAPEHRENWLGKWGGSRKRKRLAEIEASRKSGKLIKSLSQKDKIVFLSGLYWAEGSKKDFAFTNTDPDMIKVFVDCLEEVFNVPRNQIRASIRIYEDLDKEKCLEFWSGVAGIPTDRFVSVDVLKGKKLGKLNYGMCRIRIAKGGQMLKYITALRRRISELVFTSS